MCKLFLLLAWNTFFSLRSSITIGNCNICKVQVYIIATINWIEKSHLLPEKRVMLTCFYTNENEIKIRDSFNAIHFQITFGNVHWSMLSGPENGIFAFWRCCSNVWSMFKCGFFPEYLAFVELLLTVYLNFCN